MESCGSVRQITKKSVLRGSLWRHGLPLFVWCGAGFSELEMVPRVGVEPARPYGQRILSPSEGILPNLTK